MERRLGTETGKGKVLGEGVEVKSKRDRFGRMNDGSNPNGRLLGGMIYVRVRRRDAAPIRYPLVSQTVPPTLLRSIERKQRREPPLLSIFSVICEHCTCNAARPS